LIEAAGSFRVAQCFVRAAFGEKRLHSEFTVMPEWKSLKGQHLKEFLMAASC